MDDMLLFLETLLTPGALPPRRILVDGTAQLPALLNTDCFRCVPRYVARPQTRQFLSHEGCLTEVRLDRVGHGAREALVGKALEAPAFPTTAKGRFAGSEACGGMGCCCPQRWSDLGSSRVEQHSPIFDKEVFPGGFREGRGRRCWNYGGTHQGCCVGGVGWKDRSVGCIMRGSHKWSTPPHCGCQVEGVDCGKEEDGN